MQKKTDELLNELKHSALSDFISENDTEFLSGEFKDYLMRLADEKGMTRAEIIRRAGLFDVYAYQIFAGKKHPSRDNAVRLCFGLALDSEEASELLKHSGYAPLYPRNKRDSVIISALENHLSVTELNLKLDDLALAPLI